MQLYRHLMIPQIVVPFSRSFLFVFTMSSSFLAICNKQDTTCHSYHIHHSSQGVFKDHFLLYRTDLFIEHKFVSYLHRLFRFFLKAMVEYLSFYYRNGSNTSSITYILTSNIRSFTQDIKPFLDNRIFHYTDALPFELEARSIHTTPPL